MPKIYTIQEGMEDILNADLFSNILYETSNSYTHIEYKHTQIPIEQIALFFSTDCTSAKGIKPERILLLFKDIAENHITLTPISAKKLAKMEHKGKAHSFIAKYKHSGLTKCPEEGLKKSEDELKELFQNEKRFKGRAPRILPQIAAVCEYYSVPLEKAVEKFSIQYVKTLLDLGLPKIEVVLLYTHLSEQQISRVSNNLHIAQMVSTLIDKSYKKNANREISARYLNAAFWIADHTNTDIKLLQRIYKKVAELSLHSNTSIDNVKAQFSSNKALSEVAKIEKAYKRCNFKLKNCVCKLKKTTVVNNRYKAEILEGNDPRQVMLGYDTDCCQHLGEAGESAMMHGLLHPKAGFWVVTKKDSDKVVAQAEVWELNRNTLVFDNIEFANDAEIDQYKEIIGKWISESPYKNIIMGCGYNELDNGTFKYAGAVIPPVTPYELYVLSYEDDCYARDEICELESEEKAKELLENGQITYYDYVYCDSENISVYLKENDIIADFFKETTEKEITEEDMDREL